MYLTDVVTVAVQLVTTGLKTRNHGTLRAKKTVHTMSGLVSVISKRNRLRS